MGDILSSKAQNMIDLKMGTPKEIYAAFDKAYTEDAKSFTNPKRLYNYFKTLYDIYKSGDGSVSMSMLFDKYEEISKSLSLKGQTWPKVG